MISMRWPVMVVVDESDPFLKILMMDHSPKIVLPIRMPNDEQVVPVVIDLIKWMNLVKCSSRV